jgi:haloalkane dehalogenase
MRGEKIMKRRDFLYGSAAMTVRAAVMPLKLAYAKTTNVKPIDAKVFHTSRKFANLSISRVAYFERGHGQAALFVHGYPLNGFQWRGAIERLQDYRRCIAPDVMGMGHTETPEGQAISPEIQADMLAELLDSLHIDEADLIANDSGGLVAQLFVAKYPKRVRSLLLTNCDVDENSPPPQFLPLIKLAKEGTLVDKFIAPQLADKQLARSPKGMGGLAYTYPDRLTDETIETYFRPFVENPATKVQMQRYAVSMEANPLIAVREDLRQWKGPVRMVWGLKDTLFGVEWAEWLDRTMPGSRGVRRIEGANLFFPEEMPDIIAEEALALWNISPLRQSEKKTVTRR